MSEGESNQIQETRFRKIKLPKQDWKLNNKNDQIFEISKETKAELKSVFDLFAVNDKVNPHNIRNGLRKVGKNKKYQIYLLFLFFF